MNNKRTIASVATIVGILTLSLLATKPLTNQAFGQFKCPTELTVNLNPDSNKGGAGESAVTTVSGKLTCEFKGEGTNPPRGISGANIVIHGPPMNKDLTVKTDSSGAYSGSYMLRFSQCKMPFEANFAGDSEHESASSSATYHVDKLDEPCPRT
jgi:hypothetical protein